MSIGGELVARAGLKCHVCGARLTATEYIGRSFDMSKCYYRCRSCGTIIVVSEGDAKFKG
ncbi:MAG TPA: hypothetical protein ENF34_04045 [Candidatus Bathyarchaeota archaeon]|nr:hypothetical protein [Candidatus Bathyarchaeota archaeon]